MMQWPSSYQSKTFCLHMCVSVYDAFFPFLFVCVCVYVCVFGECSH